VIEEVATIVECLPDKQVRVNMIRQSACGSCASKDGCGTSVLSRLWKQKSPLLIIENTLDARPGDHVMLAVYEGDFLKAAVSVYFLPLAMMLLMALSGAVLTASLGLENGYADGIILLFALAGLYLSKLYHYFFRLQRLKPKMLRVLSPTIQIPLNAVK